MADRYLDSSAAGTPASPWQTYGTDEAHALNTFDAVALAINETIWVGSSHSETLSSIPTYTSSANATAYAPQRLVCVSNPGTNTTLASTATISTTGNYGVIFEGYWYIYGLVFDFNSSSSSNDISLGYSTAGPHNITLDNCKIKLGNSSTADIELGNTGSASNDETNITVVNTSVYFRNTGNSVKLNHGKHFLRNISIDSGSSATPTSLFTSTASVTFISLVEDSDLTGKNFTNLFEWVTGTTGIFYGRNLKLPSGCTYCTDISSAPGIHFRLDDFSDGTTYVPFYRRSYSGEVKYNSTIKSNSTTDRLYLQDDEADGGYSIHLDSATTACSFWEPLYSDWIHINVEDTSTAITPYAEILVEGDGATALTDREAWIEVDANATATYHVATRYADSPTIIATGTNQDSGTISFTGHGYSSPTTHKLALGSSFTPAQKGYIRIRVALAKANAGIFIGKVGYS